MEEDRELESNSDPSPRVPKKPLFSGYTPMQDDQYIPRFVVRCVVRKKTDNWRASRSSPRAAFCWVYELSTRGLFHFCFCSLLRGPGKDRELCRSEPSPRGVELRANLKSISYRYYIFEVAFLWVLTTETMNLTLSCLQGGVVRDKTENCVSRSPPRAAFSEPPTDASPVLIGGVRLF